MGNLKESFQIITAIVFQQLLNVLPMFRRFPSFQEICRRFAADGAVRSMPRKFQELRLVKLVAIAKEGRNSMILVHQRISRRAFTALHTHPLQTDYTRTGGD